MSTLEDTSYVFDTTDFGFTDPNDSPANQFSAVHFTTVPSAGSLTNDGSAVTAGSDVPVADIAGGKLSYLPAEDANGTPYRTFTFRVRDDGGTLSSGVDTDPSPNTMTIDVTSVSDAPSGANGGVSTPGHRLRLRSRWLRLHRCERSVGRARVCEGDDAADVGNA